MHKLTDWLAQLQHDRRTQLALLLAPRVVKLPLVIQRYDDPFLPYGKAIINATRDLVCAYVFDLAAYLSIGAAGMVALERTIAYASNDAITIVHGPFAGTDYVTLLDESSLNANAVTLVSRQDITAYTSRPDRTAFVVQRGQPQPGDLSRSGMYWQDASLLILPTQDAVMELRLAGDTALLAGMGEDFAEQIRAALETIR